MIVSIVVNLTGTILKGIDQVIKGRIEFFLIYPALIGLVSDVGSVVDSTAATNLSLDFLAKTSLSVTMPQNCDRLFVLL
jgi:cation transporter-like permease